MIRSQFGLFFLAVLGFAQITQPGAGGGGGTGATTPNTSLPICGNGAANSTKACVSGTDYQPPIAAGTYATPPDVQVANLLTTLAQSSNTPQRIDVFGDSETRCSQDSPNAVCGGTGPTHNDALWIEKLRTKLSLQYGNRGRGMIPLQSQVFGGGTFDTLNWTITGTVTPLNFSGPYSDAALGSIIQMEPAAVATFKQQYGKSFVIACDTGGDNTGLNVTIDGVSAGASICVGGGAATPHLVTVTASAGLGVHDVAITPVSGHGYLYGAAAIVSDTGVVLNNYSEGACKAYCFGNDPAVQESFSDLASENLAAVVISLETNEALNATSTSTFIGWITNIVTHERALNANATIIIVPGPYVQSASITPYVDALRTYAAANNCIFYDVATQLFVSYANEVTKGWITGDGIHLTDAGSTAWGSWLLGKMFGSSSTVTNFNFRQFAIGGGTTFTGGTIANPLTVAIGSTPGPAIHLGNTVAADFSSVSYVGTAREVITGVGNPSSTQPNTYFVYDQQANRFNFTIDTNGFAHFVSDVYAGKFEVNNASTGFSLMSAQGSGRNYAWGVGNATGGATSQDKYFVYDATAGQFRFLINTSGIPAFPAVHAASGTAPVCVDTSGNLQLCP